MHESWRELFATLCDFRSYSQTALSGQQLQWFKYAAQSGTATLLHNELGEPKGYIVWAEVNRATLHQLWATRQFPRYVYEWREGRIRLILDISIDPGERRAVLRSLRQQLAQWPVIAFLRRDLRIYRRQSTGFRRLA